MSKVNLGIIGGGQLGSMLSTAAKKLDIKTIIYCDDIDAPAQNFCDEFILGEYNNKEKIDEFINKAYADKVSKLIVVTGKGKHSENEKDPYLSKDLSILKYSVPDYILKNKNLMNMIIDIKDAKIEDGGSGAFYIFLKK